MNMRFLKEMVLSLALAVSVIGCGGDGGDGGGGGGEVNSDEALGAMMDVIAVDLANVLGDIAPDPDLLAEKQNGLEGTTDCPQGGTARYEPSSMLGGGGTIYLESCEIEGITWDGDLAGYLELDSASIEMHRQVHLIMGRGLTPIEVSGRYRATLTVDYFEFSADYPDPDPFFIWYDIQARSPFPIRARSCDPDCQELLEL
jgi:hypothetical protein